jgi:RecA-family ATPase
MPKVANHQPLIDAFTKLMPRRAAPAAKVVNPETAPAEVVQKLLDKAQKEPLWTGNWQAEVDHKGTPYPSQSEADFALLSIILRQAITLGISQGEAADAAIRVFEQSNLYRPEKRQRVLTQDIPNLIASNYVSATQSHLRSSEAGYKPRLTSGRINFSSTPPPLRDYVLEDIILSKKVCVLGGLGGVSKTMYSMQLAVSIALGRDFLGKPTKTGSVLLILGEEDQEEIDRRFNAICTDLKLSPAEIQLVDERVRAYPMNGLDARFTKKDMGSLEGTDFPAEIIAAASELEMGSGLPLALIGLDHAGLIHGGEFNSREDVVQTMRQANYVSSEVGAATLVLAHSPKTSIGKDESDQNDVTGSAAWVDLSRAAFILRAMSLAEAKEFGISKNVRGNYVSFSVVKNNYGPTGDKIWLERFPVPAYSVSVLIMASGLVKPQPVNATRNLNAQVKAFIGLHPGQYTKTSLRNTQGGKSGPFKIGKYQVAASVEDLLASGELQLVPPTDEQREKFGLRAQVTQVLEAV